MKYLKMLSLPTSPDKLRQEQANEAKLLALDHRARGERELALAEMYEKQAARLADPPVVSFPEVEAHHA